MRTILAILLATGAIFAQANAPKAHEFHGKVTEVNADSKSLTVQHDAVPGWMDAMTMSYPVDKEAVLKEIHTGDQIAATVYDGDLTLHNVHAVKPKAHDAKAK